MDGVNPKIQYCSNQHPVLTEQLNTLHLQEISPERMCAYSD